MSAWAWGWIIWGALFAAFETAGIVRNYQAKRAGEANPRYTLSQHIWYWSGFTKRPEGRFLTLRRAALLMGLAWLVGHFLGGGDVV